MNNKIHIALCMGSSCFARGNNIVLDTLEHAIVDNNWQDKVALSGLRCQNHCAQGPNITVDGSLHQALDAENVLDLVIEKLGLDPASVNLSALRRQPAPEKGGA